MKITLTLVGLALVAFASIWFHSLLRARVLSARLEICKQQAREIVANIKAQYPGCEGAVMENKPADMKVVRDTFQQINKQLCSSIELLSEPLKSMFSGIKKEFDDKLSQLAPTDQVPASLDINYQLQSLLSCLYSVNTMVGLLNQSLDGMSKQRASLVATEIEKQITEGLLIRKDDVAKTVTTEIEAKVTAGDLVAKDTVAQLCSQSEKNGIAKGEAELRRQLMEQEAATKKVGERKASLQTAGKPIPDADVEKILGGTDQEYATRLKRFETRQAELTGKGFTLNSPELLANLWKEDDAYHAFVNVISAIPAMKGQGEPFAGAGGKTKTGPATGLPMMV